MDSFDSLVVTMAIIGVCSAVIFILGLIEMVLPWFDRKPRRQATYRPRSGKA